MSLIIQPKKIVFSIFAASIFGVLAIGWQPGLPALAGTDQAPSRPIMLEPSQTAPNVDFQVYLPTVIGPPPWISPFGVEPVTPMVTGSTNFTRTLELDNGWIRLGTRIHWRALQPNEGDPIPWSQLATFENELRSLKAAGIVPLVTITDSPAWATISDSPCGAIRTEKFPAFAEFMGQLVTRYMSPEFDVHNWELGNEPDVDPRLVPKDSVFGCWGNADEPDYYGGRQYGEMLKVVTPAIRQADPGAKVWIGGLLLDSPSTSTGCGLSNCGRPEWFLKGILQAGAAPYFDVLAYHSYLFYSGPKVDPDISTTSDWYPWGGVVVGKARFLRQTLQSYGVDNKPLSSDETGLLYYSGTPGESFYQAQADHVVRSYTRALAENISSVFWYTLEGPGWRYSGLLNNGNPNLSFIAYQQLIQRLKDASYLGTVSYDANIEAYAFDNRQQKIQVVWTKMDQTIELQIPGAKFIAAYSRDGNPITPTPSGQDYLLSVGFSPIYIVFAP